MEQTKHQTESILKQLTELEDLSTDKLKARWWELYASDPPRFNRRFLIKGLSYRIQEIAYGGIPDTVRSRMDRLLDDEGYDELGVKSRPKKRKPGDALLPGTLLAREWRGERHEVIVGEDRNFEYRGRPYRSLSAVARAITGTRWNGPKFFGLRPREAGGWRLEAGGGLSSQ